MAETMTLLQIVQEVLSSMDSDEVNSISDTVESEQVATIARRVYDDLMVRADWDHLKKTRELTGLGDTNRPTTMGIPAGVSEILVVKYDATKTTDDHRIMVEPSFEEDSSLFLDRLYSRNTSNDNVVVKETLDGVPLFLYNDRAPCMYTTFNGTELVFDAYNSDEDTTLQGSKSIAECIMSPSWTHENTAIPAMPAKLFPMFFAKVKAVAHEEIKQNQLVGAREDFKTGFNRQRRLANVKAKIRRKDYGRHK